MHSETVSSDKKVVEEYLKTVTELIEMEGYVVPQQVLHCDETELFWKKTCQRGLI